MQKMGRNNKRGKLKEERIPRSISLAWTAAAKSSLIIKWGYGSNPLVFGKKPGELIPISTEIGGRGGILEEHSGWNEKS